MPIYEYKCRNCQSTSSHFTRKVSDPVEPSCPACGSPEMERLISKVAYHRSMKDIHEASGQPDEPHGLDYYNDPRNIGRWTEKKFTEMGIEVPKQVRTMIDAAREGELPPAVKDI